MHRLLPWLCALLFVQTCFPAPAAPRVKNDRQQHGTQYWGVPDAMQCGQPTAFGIASYDGRIRTCRYVLEYLTASSLKADAGKRELSHFHVDADWPVEFRATLADYREVSAEFDRGHLANAANHARSQAEMDATFALSNMAPQNQTLNRGLWKQLETYLRDVAQREEVAGVWVVTVPLWMPDDAPAQGTATTSVVTYRLAGPNHLPIPTHFGKAALCQSTNNAVALRCWCIPNRAPAAGKGLDDFRCSTDFLEHWSGLNFWEALPADDQAKLEALQ